MAITREEIVAALEAIERQLAERLVIRRVILNGDGQVVHTITRVITRPKGGGAQTWLTQPCLTWRRSP